MNSQGLYFEETTWSSKSHDKFIEALLEGNVERVEESCREIMRNAILFLREIHIISHQIKIPDSFEDLSYNTEFINSVYSVEELSDFKSHLMNSSVDDTKLIQNLVSFVHYCRGEDCQIEHGTECGVGLAFLSSLGELLRAEAVAITSEKCRNLGRFIKSPINRAISRGLGVEVLACIDHFHAESCRPHKAVFPLDHVPCDLLFCEVAKRFEVSIESLLPRHSEAAMVQMSIATDLVKKEKTVLQMVGRKPALTVDV
jgi:hypothetical protein